jgi:hypothetical protein
MATTYKILGQSTPVVTFATNLTAGLITLFSQSCVVSTVTITNTTPLPVVYSIYIARNGSSTTNESTALIYRQTINPYDIIPLTMGITLGFITGSDNIYVQSETASALTFMAFGSKIS